MGADLEAEAAALKRKHGGRAPAASEFLTTAACNNATPVTAAHDEGSFLHGRVDDHTHGFVEQILGNAFRHAENFLEDDSGLIEAFDFLLILFLVFGESREGEHECESGNAQLCFHTGSSPGVCLERGCGLWLTNTTSSVRCGERILIVR